jgi:hypothetical protein
MTPSRFIFCLLPLLPAPFLLAQTVIDDSWADGDFTDGADPLDSAWFGTTGDSAIEMFGGNLSLRSGTSGRGIHSPFALQTLTNVGDSLRLSYTFSTPDTIGVDRDASLRVGLFNSGGADLARGGFASRETVWNTVLGYMQDFDVGIVTKDPADISFRESLVARTTDRLMGTTVDYTTIGGGGVSYDFFDNSTYTGTFEITRTGLDELTLSGTLSLGETELSATSVTTTAGIFEFDLLAFHVNSNTFGSTADGGVADNGIDFANVTLVLTVVPEPSAVPLVLGLGAGLVFLRRRRR